MSKITTTKRDNDNFLNMTRIRGILLITLISALALIRADFVINLDNKDIRNAIVVRINETEKCMLVSELFPSRTIVTEERSFTDDAFRIRGKEHRNIEPVIVIIYNIQTDTLCDRRRKHLLADASPLAENNSTSGSKAYQLFSMCTSCSQHNHFISPRLITSSASPKISSSSSTRRLKSFCKHNNTSAKVTDYPVHQAKLHSITSHIGAPSSILLWMHESHLFVSDDPKGLPNLDSSRRQLVDSTIYGIGVRKNELTANLTSTTSTNVTHSKAKSLFRSPVQPQSTTYSMIGTNSRASTASCSTDDGDECCSDLDCSSLRNNVCANRHCVAEGYPRFTLEWYGYDDYDLIVTTPSGIALSFVIEYDPTTGGKVGEIVDQTALGYHTENTYFPLTGAPVGAYSYSVKQFAMIGSDAGDEWTLSVHDERGEVARYTGKGASDTFMYERTVLSAPSLPHPPTQPPGSRPCSSNYDECCSESGCLLDGEICVNRNCIAEGSPRFTLYWEGDDDIDLFVTTPGGEELSFVNFFDPLSGGRVGEETDQFGSGFHVENVFFPKDGSTLGTFNFLVRPISTFQGADKWTVDVVANGEVVMSESGYGESSQFSYRKTSTPSSPTNGPAPTLSPNQRPSDGGDHSCSIFFDECCSDSDCQTGLDLCVQKTCIRDGNPRFTLTWNGDDDLDFFVITPLGTEISNSQTFDALSGGSYENDGDQGQAGAHVENIYFPVSGAPSGQFSYGVRSSNSNGFADPWVIHVYEDGELVDTKLGSGESVLFDYLRNGFDGPQRPPPESTRCSPLMDDCCLDSDCDSDDEICVQRSCIEEGYPRITLTWTGDDDLDLRVVTPNGAVLSRQNEFDPVSGGRFKADRDQSEFGFHVETVNFPDISGKLKFFVKSRTTRGAGADIWNLAVYESDTMVQDHSGFGDSRDFFYHRDDNLDEKQCPNECCADYDCSPSELCVQRSCIADGALRFTLTWTGNDYIGLRVVTPEQTPISSMNPIDDNSGGFFEEDPARGSFGFHVENVVFMGSSIQEGEYRYSARSKRTFGAQDDWELRIYAYAQLVGLRRGKGDSISFTYFFDSKDTFPPSAAPPTGSETLSPTPSSLTNPPSAAFEPTGLTEIPSANPSINLEICEPLTDQCCDDSDCGPLQVCVQRICIDEGNPRFTLQWTGNDDLDLVVKTPLGSIVSFLQDDPISGGSFGPGGDQFGFGLHVESIRFKGDSAGIFEFFVDAFLETGEADMWKVSVFVDGQEVDSLEGTGNSSKTYLYMPTGASSSQTSSNETKSSLSPTTPTFDGDCYNANDCVVGIETCVNQVCISLGNPRFTLTWTGDDVLDLDIETPSGSFISFRRPMDEISGGIYEEDGNQDSFGLHVENIVFPSESALSGLYKYKVNNFIQRGAIDHWTLGVFVNNTLVETKYGKGDSLEFEVDFGSSTSRSGIFSTELAESAGSDNVLNSSELLATIQDLDATTNCSKDLGDHCCAPSDCSRFEVCFQRTCINDGNPRFTLVWNGADDYNLEVLPPIGEFVSFVNQLDEDSGGRYEPDPKHGWTGVHVENIFFPRGGGLIGSYTVHVKLPFSEARANDHWTVLVYVDGEQVYQNHGVGESAPLTYDSRK
jgi:hypothetical protein